MDQQKLTDNGSVTFSSNIGEYFNGNYAYIKNNDTIPVFWQAIADLSILYTSAEELSGSENMLKVFPNPKSESLSIQVPLQFGTVSEIEIFSSSGQLVLTTRKTNDINIARLDSGLYLVKATNKIGNKLWARAVKE